MRQPMDKHLLLKDRAERLIRSSSALVAGAVLQHKADGTANHNNVQTRD
jgi:hypothetical protein